MALDVVILSGVNNNTGFAPAVDPYAHPCPPSSDQSKNSGRRATLPECLLRPRRHTARFTIRSLIFSMASVGFSPFGHTSTQFMMV